MYIEVIYARPGRSVCLDRELPAGSTVSEAIRACGLLERCPEIDFKRNKVGIFGRLAHLDTQLRDGDRVEIYRPLSADPKEVRRRRAAMRPQRRSSS